MNKDVQKESTLQPITKTNSKLDKELQEWEVESLRKVAQMRAADEKNRKKRKVSY